VLLARAMENRADQSYHAFSQALDNIDRMDEGDFRVLVGERSFFDFSPYKDPSEVPVYLYLPTEKGALKVRLPYAFPKNISFDELKNKVARLGGSEEMAEFAKPFKQEIKKSLEQGKEYAFTRSLQAKELQIWLGKDNLDPLASTLLVSNIRRILMEKGSLGPNGIRTR